MKYKAAQIRAGSPMLYTTTVYLRLSEIILMHLSLEPKEHKKVLNNDISSPTNYRTGFQNKPASGVILSVKRNLYKKSTALKAASRYWSTVTLSLALQLHNGSSTNILFSSNNFVFGCFHQLSTSTYFFIRSK